MAAGDLTLTSHGLVAISGQAIKTVVDAINLAATTDFLYIIPTSNGQQVLILEVERAAA